MKYSYIPGEPGAIVWEDDTGSGVIRAGHAGWEEFQQWQAEGNQPESIVSADTRTLDELRQSALRAINIEMDIALSPITSRYSRGEIDSWPEQCTEARAWLKDSTAHTALLDAIIGDATKEEMEAFCLKVLGKSTVYKQAAGLVIAWRRAICEWVLSQVEREQLLNFAPQFPRVPNE